MAIEKKRVSEMPITPDGQESNVDIFVYNRVSGESNRVPFDKLLEPATDAANEIKSDWNNNVKPELEEAIDNANTAAENVKDGKTPVIENMPTAQIDPSLPAQVVFTLVGTDENGNPVYQQTAQIPRAKLPISFGTEEPTDPDILIWFNTAAFDPIRLTGGNMRISNNSIRI